VISAAANGISAKGRMRSQSAPVKDIVLKITCMKGAYTTTSVSLWIKESVDHGPVTE